MPFLYLVDWWNDNTKILDLGQGGFVFLPTGGPPNVLWQMLPGASWLEHLSFFFSPKTGLQLSRESVSWKFTPLALSHGKPMSAFLPEVER